MISTKGPLGSKPVPEGVADNSLVAILGKIYFEYYYYNGKEWILDFEELNDDYSEDFYTVYKNSLGQRFYESKWSYPPILYTYDETYINKIMNHSDMTGNTNLLVAGTIDTNAFIAGTSDTGAFVAGTSDTNKFAAGTSDTNKFAAGTSDTGKW